MKKEKKMDEVAAMKLIKDDVIKDFEIVHGILETTLTAFGTDISNGYWGELGKSYATEAAIKDSLVKLSRDCRSCLEFRRNYRIIGIENYL